MELCTISEVRKMIEGYYGMEVVSVEYLEGYEDLNLRLTTKSNEGEVHDVVLKLSPLVSPKVACSVDLQTSIMQYLLDNGVPVSNVIKTSSDELYFVQNSDEGTDLCGRLLSYLSGKQLDKIQNILPLLNEVGNLVGQMDRVLKSFSPSQQENIDTEWGLSKALLMRKMLPFHCQDLQRLGTEILDEFEIKLLPVIHRFQSGYIHGDVIGCNILVSKTGNSHRYVASGIIDFGDACYGTFVYEIATLMADVMALYPENAMEAGKELLNGFRSKFNLFKEELTCLRLCICVRLLQVVVLSEKAALNNPVNRMYITRRNVPYLKYCKTLWEIGEDDFRKYLKIETNK